MADKVTIQDYIDFFGEKSSEADVALESIFGSNARRLTEEEMMFIAGLVDPGGKLKTMGKAVSKGGTRIVDILKEMFGKGKREIGDIQFKRGTQPSDFIPEGKPGQQELFKQALKLPAQNIGPSQRAAKEIDATREGIKTLGEALGKKNKQGVSEVDVEDLFKFFSKKN